MESVPDMPGQPARTAHRRVPPARRLARAFGAAAMLLCALLLPGGVALALDPALGLHDYRHDDWRRQDGAPANISGIAQTTDGWIWIGTFNGLYRFDGLSFERFQPPGGRRLRAPRISAMAANAGGDLLVGYYNGGIDIIRNGELLAPPAGQDAPTETVFDLVGDVDGAIWVGTYYGIRRYADGAWRRAEDNWGLPAQMTEELTLDQYGQLWALTAGVRYKFDRERQRFVATATPAGVGVFFSPDGQMWQRRGSLIERVPSGQAGPVRPRDERRRHFFGKVDDMFDADGNLWLLRAPGGVARVRRQDIPAQGSFDPARLPLERIDQPWRQSGLAPTAILEDREGNIWVTTRAGLSRFRNTSIRVIKIPLGVDMVDVVADAEGNIRAGGANMDRLWAVSEGAAPPPVVPTARRIAVLGRDGALVSNGPDGIERRLGRRTEVLPLPQRCAGKTRALVNRLVEDRDSTWVAIATCGIFRHVGGAWQAVRDYGLPRGIVYFTAGADGAVWFAHKDGDLWRFADGALRKVVATAQLGSDRFIDAQQEVFLSGANGSAVLKGQRLERLSARVPEALNGVAGLMITPDGDRWLNGAAGLVHVKAADWRASVADPRIPMPVEIFSDKDGYPGGIVPLPLPNGAVDRAGRLWIAGTEGIGVLDPRRLYRNPVAPTVRITGLRAGGRRYQPGPGLRLPESASTVEIRFAALSLSVPERMQVLYRLEAVDRDWQQAGTMRRATYANLAPGDYRFLVKAANADGVWNQDGAVLGFHLAPRFTQTGWFYLLCAAGVAALAWLLYLLRMRQVVTRLNAVLGARMLERERIARALHDNLLQDVQGLMWRFAGLSYQLPEDSPARGEMRELLAQGESVIVDGRNAVLGLRVASVRGDDVLRAFRDLGERLQKEYGAAYTLGIDGAPRSLDGAVWDEVFHVGHEALHNAFRHARARCVALGLDFGHEAFALTVRDDGAGIPEPVLREGSSAGHWGLVGMRERAQLVDGCLDVRSARGVTEVCLRIPAARAYAGAAAPGCLARLARLLPRRR